MTEVIIKFEDEEDAKNFVSWMDDSGEQVYWEAITDMTEEKGVMFDYGEYWKGDYIINTVKRS